ncbi:hypothetical protein SAY86_023674 [Trapa natans]|uniref:Cyclin-D1-binding protein 1-like N-terminal domain-containing protein n=1 Tax=Trapa natans TaxID=22666 RepID=A0AAN7LW63_TRANT|nr:hypothetical protein SAY86_023674 [Trapa natans]
MLYQAGQLRTADMEDSMGTVFLVIQELIWNVLQMLPKAGPTLIGFLDGSFKDIRDCTSDLLNCTLVREPYGSLDDSKQIPGSARRALDIFKSLKKIPRTNSEAIRMSLLRILKDINSVISEIEAATLSSGKSEEQSSMGYKQGQENEEAGNNREYSQEEQEAITALVIGTLSFAFATVSYLISVVKFGDAEPYYGPGFVMCMEHELSQSIKLKNVIYKIKDYLFPLREVEKILKLADEMNEIVDSMERLLGPYMSIWPGFYRRIYLSICNAIQELQDALSKLLTPEDRHQAVGASN